MRDRRYAARRGVASAEAYDSAVNPFRPLIFGLLLGGAAILATILAAQLGDDDDDAPPSPGGVQAPAPAGLADVFPAGFEVAAVTLSRGGLLSPTHLPRDVRRTVDRLAIEKLYHWVDEADRSRQPVRLTSGANPGLGYLELSARDGRTITMTSAYDCQSNETRTTCEPLPNSVDVIRADQPLRLYSPELTAWLRDGWQRDMRTGTADDFAREWRR